MAESRRRPAAFFMIYGRRSPSCSARRRRASRRSTCVDFGGSNTEVYAAAARSPVLKLPRTGGGSVPCGPAQSLSPGRHVSRPGVKARSKRRMMPLSFAGCASGAFVGSHAPPPSPARRQERCHCRRRSRIVQGTAAAVPGRVASIRRPFLEQSATRLRRSCVVPTIKNASTGEHLQQPCPGIGSPHKRGRNLPASGCRP
jgi:hypothetical protein